MTTVEVIPYKTFKERIQEMKKLERKHRETKHKIEVCEEYIYCISRKRLDYE